MDLAHPMERAARRFESTHELDRAEPLWLTLLQHEPRNQHYLSHLALVRLTRTGRAAARESLKPFWSLKNDKVPVDRLSNELREAVERVEQSFLSDEGQSYFLQGKSRFEVGDLTGAVPYLDKAIAVEHEHGGSLWLRALVAKGLGRNDVHLDLLSKLNQFNPSDAKIAEELAEAFLMADKFQMVQELTNSPWHPSSSSRFNLADLYARYKNKEVRVSEIMRWVERSKDQPIVYYMAGHILKSQDEFQEASRRYFKRFVSALENPKPATITSWDPYRLQEKLGEVKEILSAQGT